ncbi:Sorting nexin-10B [Acipenser ruthenus]|uniref:Sorting nexin-10B n=1 Tax=Acipenser ruthenus TaxID=7906 RepID=A0A662YWC1_ACIRT|nr:Sorting nexin-10B [Acipenser ruthenus]
MLLQEFVSVWVRDPRIQKEDSWQSYVDYEICVHSKLSPTKIEACVSGQTKYTVAEVIQRYACANSRFPVEEKHKEKSPTYSDSDSESSSSVLGHGSDDSAPQDCKTEAREGELFRLLSASPSEEHQVQP